MFKEFTALNIILIKYVILTQNKDKFKAFLTFIL